jgi:hypothetical protein
MLSDECQKFIRCAYKDGKPVQEIRLDVARMRLNGKKPCLQTVYNIADGIYKNKKDKKKPGREPYFHAEKTRRLTKFLDKENKKTNLGIEITASILKRKLKFRGISDETLRRALAKAGYRWLRPRRAADLTKEDRKDRKKFCAKYMNFPISVLKRKFGLCLDEKTFVWRSMPAGRMYERRKEVRGAYAKKDKRGKRIPPTRPGGKNAPGRSKGGKIGVCAGFVDNRMVLWHAYKGCISAKKFCSSGLRRALEGSKEMGKRGTRVILMDNCKAHRAKKTDAFLDDLGVNCIDFPVRSPDLMPLDFTIWRALLYRLRRQEEKIKGRETLGAFKARLRRTAMRLPEDFFDRVWGEWRRRLRRCHEAGGGHFEGGHLVKTR